MAPPRDTLRQFDEINMTWLCFGHFILAQKVHERDFTVSGKGRQSVWLWAQGLRPEAACGFCTQKKPCIPCSCDCPLMWHDVPAVSVTSAARSGPICAEPVIQTTWVVSSVIWTCSMPSQLRKLSPNKHCKSSRLRLPVSIWAKHVVACPAQACDSVE